MHQALKQVHQMGPMYSWEELSSTLLNTLTSWSNILTAEPRSSAQADQALQQEHLTPSIDANLALTVGGRPRMRWPREFVFVSFKTLFGLLKVGDYKLGACKHTGGTCVCLVEVGNMSPSNMPLASVSCVFHRLQCC